MIIIFSIPIPTRMNRTIIRNPIAFYEPFEHLRLRYRINVIISIENKELNT